MNKYTFNQLEDHLFAVYNVDGSLFDTYRTQKRAADIMELLNRNLEVCDKLIKVTRENKKLKKEIKKTQEAMLTLVKHFGNIVDLKKFLKK